MNSVTATLSNFRQSPRKMRTVANLVRGKKVSDALVNLEFINKKASDPIRNLVASALANAKSLGMENPENLIIKTITVNSGRTLQRRQPAARGSAHPIHKRTSHVTVELSQPVEGKNKKVKVIKEKIKEEPVKKSIKSKVHKEKTKKN